MDEGDFEASRREAGEALAMLDPNSRDIAFYQIGLIDANPLNPKADYIESIRSFEKIILEFPKSYLKEEAVIWVLTLKKTIEAEREISELRKELTNLETASKEREKVMKSREAAVDDKERKLNLVMQDINKSDSLNNKLKEEVKELRAKLAQLEEQLKNLKNVDLSIEKKKRETMPRQ
jgi:DNA repair ATPase RecN